MRRLSSLVRLLPIAAAVASCASAPAAPPAKEAPAVRAVAAPPPALAPPVARRETHVESLHGAPRADDYFWLRRKGTPEVEAYLQAENAYTEAAMKPTAALQDTLYREMLARIKETDISVPFRDSGWFYYDKTVEGQQYKIHCRKSARGAARGDRTGATATAPEEVLLDLNEIGRTHKFVAVGPMEVSDDGNRLAYALDTTGFRQYTLQVKDLATGKVFPEAVPRVDAVAWASDGRTLFYVTEDETTKRRDHLYRHVVGSDGKDDVLVYEEKDALYDLDIERTRSRGYLVLTSVSKTTSEVRVLRADRPTGAWQVVEPRQHDVKYLVDHRGDRFFIVTDAPATPGGAKARNNRLVSAPVASPGRSHWKELIPHRADVMLTGVELFADFTVVHERADALQHVRILPVTGKAGEPGEPREIDQAEAVYALEPSINPDFQAGAYRYVYESPVTPKSVYDYDVRTHRSTLLKQDEVLGGYDAARYTTERIHAKATDGTEIPISLVHKKDLPPGPHPTLLYGYGSYGVFLQPRFSSNRVSLLDRGGVFALAHIRGGGDLGKVWHEQGRMANKMNTFTDFIACAEELVADGRTRSDELAIQGASAGGLLMGAVTNLRPDLFKAVVAQVPFVDVINTMLDETLPLTVSEFEEWGNPKVKDEYDVMIRYSPYDNVTPKAYPAMLVMTSYNDSQVMYWEPSKYVARLRAMKTDRHPLVFKINMEPAGHGGQSGRYDRLHEDAFWMAFVLAELDLADGVAPST